MTNEQYPLYDVPWLVRDHNEFRMSAKRHDIEIRNQTVVDDYFILRSKNVSAEEAKEIVAEKHRLTTKRVRKILKWFYEEAQKRKKYAFLEKFSFSKEH